MEKSYRLCQFMMIVSFLLLLFGCGWLLSWSKGPARTYIVIEDKDLSRGQIYQTEPLTGYRKISDDFFITVRTKKKKLGISADVFSMSAMATPWIRNEIVKTKKDLSTASLEDLFTAANSVGALKKISSERPMTMEVELTPHRYGPIDPKLIASLPATEVFESDRPMTYPGSLEGKEMKWMKVNEKAFSAFAQAYSSLAKMKDQPLDKGGHIFLSASGAMAPYPFLSKAAEFNSGQVSFGKPIVSTSEETGLNIPRSITSKFDVYVMKFAVSFRDIDYENIEKLVFSVLGPNGISALELIPLRFDEEMSVRCIVSSPELKIKYGNKAIELGKVYEKEIIYKVLKPKIIANGLQENEFSWSMMEGSIQPGAKRFISILEVPKGREWLTLQFQASARAKSGWIAQGDTISTKPVLIDINLPVD